MVRDAIWEHEEKTTQEIKVDKTSKKLWQHIKKLKGEPLEEKREIMIYDENGVKLKDEDIPEKIESFWKQVYQRHDNKIDEIWNQEQQKKYEINTETEKNRKMIAVTGEQESQLVRYEIREHMDLVSRTLQYIEPMNDHKVTMEEVRATIEKSKRQKKSGT